MDNDGDCVADVDDRCPDYAYRGLDGCPPIDADDDGWPDPIDRCPEAAGHGPEGCPLPDLDGDGVDDLADRCPALAETSSSHEDGDGCPTPVPADLAAILGVLDGVAFTDDEALQPRSRAALERVAAVLRRYPLVRLQIWGHTALPDCVYGTCRGTRRVAAVVRYLVERGISAERLWAIGEGDEFPIADNATAAGRRKNQRIELILDIRPAARR